MTQRYTVRDLRASVIRLAGMMGCGVTLSPDSPTAGGTVGAMCADYGIPVHRICRYPDGTVGWTPNGDPLPDGAECYALGIDHAYGGYRIEVSTGRTTGVSLLGWWRGGAGELCRAIHLVEDSLYLQQRIAEGMKR